MLGREEQTPSMIQVRKERTVVGRRKKKWTEEKTHRNRKIEERKIDGRDEREGEKLIFKKSSLGKTLRQHAPYVSQCVS